MVKQVEEEKPSTEADDQIVPPTKSYNLDFLDNLDDPNFNPFATKTAVKESFDASAPVSQSDVVPVQNTPTKQNEVCTENVKPEQLSIENQPETTTEQTQKSPKPDPEKSAKPDKQKPTKRDVSKPWLKKQTKPIPKADITESLPKAEDTTAADDEIVSRYRYLISIRTPVEI